MERKEEKLEIEKLPEAATCASNDFRGEITKHSEDYL